MPRTNSGKPWEQALRSSIRSSKPGWTVSEARGKTLLRYRPTDGGKPDSCLLPLPWEASSTEKILILANRIAALVAAGEQDSLKGALAAAQGSSTTMRRAADWPVIRDSLRTLLMTGRNQIMEKTWRSNYLNYINAAIAIVDAGKATDGHSLLQATLLQWEGKHDARVACCVALRALTDHGIKRHGLARCWEIGTADVKELRGKAPKQRTKATLTDAEILQMIDSLEQRNRQWANVLRLLALYGLRPVELQHLHPKQRDDGSLGLWCSYNKTCGGTLTDARWLEPCYLRDGTGEPVRWNLAGALHAGLLDLPRGRDGEFRRLEGRSVRRYLEAMPEWQQLNERTAARGEWLRPYTFRDSYSLRCHQQVIEVGSIALAMGHTLAVHSSSYRWASEQTTAAAFAAAFADAS